MKFLHLLFLSLSYLSSSPAYGSSNQDEKPLVPIGRPSKDYSFMVSLQRNGRHFCGGTLVAPSTVVTAAHCLQGASAKSINVRLGITRFSQADGETIPVSQLIIHPGFDSKILVNDIGVIKLANTSSAQPAQLDIINIGSKVGTKAIIVGWDYPRPNGPSVDQLMESDMNIAENTVCKKIFSGFNDVSSICMRSLSSIQVPCAGASGGPILVNNTLVGAVSYGVACRGESAATRINTYIDWINQHQS